MRLALIGLVILFLSYSCGEKIPEGVIRQQQMTALLLDMHLADGQLASMPIDTAWGYRDAYYSAIFNRYNIDSTTFKRSFEYYSAHPYLMNDMYIGIEKKLEQLNLTEQKAVEEKYNAQRRVDSIANANRSDSLRRIARDSLDFKRKRYMLYINGPDSLYGKPDSVTYMTLREHLLTVIGLADKAATEASPRTPKHLPSPQPAPKGPELKPILRPLKKIQ